MSAATKQKIRPVHLARRNCGVALNYAAMIKDNLNELRIRIDYAQSHGGNAAGECILADYYASKLKAIVDEVAAST